MKQTRAALDIIEHENPDKIVTFGGDCSVSLAPFSYLASKYAGDVAVLWVDSHTDFVSSKNMPRAHGYPAMNIVGAGDQVFVDFVKNPVPGDRLIYAGVGKAQLRPETLQGFETRGVTVFSPSELSKDFTEVIERIKATGASKILVHFDLDVLDPRHFRAQLFSNPDGLPEMFEGDATGKLTLDDVVRLINAVDDTAEVVALSITEHLPWDAENLRRAMARLRILN